MSRHRLLKKVETSYDDDDDEELGVSLDVVSPSLQHYIKAPSSVPVKQEDEVAVAAGGEDEEYYEDYEDDYDYYDNYDEGADDGFVKARKQVLSSLSPKAPTRKGSKPNMPKITSPITPKKAVQPQTLFVRTEVKKSPLNEMSLLTKSVAAVGEASQPAAPAPKPRPKQCSAARRSEVVAAARSEVDNNHLNMVVIGHVDAGKSTMMGHLLYLLGQVSQRVMHKYEQECKRIGKASFQFAWVLDEYDDEREKGVTIDIGVNFLKTPKKQITLLDAPGHRDFIPNMISGAAQADVAILVVNASVGEFEAGFVLDGQTREHTILARSLGVQQLIVAVNKMDTVAWSEDRYTEIKDKVGHFVKQTGFPNSAVTFIPCSGLTGENLVKRTVAELSSWYKGPTLVEQIDHFKPIERTLDKPLRMTIFDVFKGLVGSCSVSGKIESGIVSVGDSVIVIPCAEIATVKNIKKCGEDVKWAWCGDNVELQLHGIDRNNVRSGGFVCDPEHPIEEALEFEAQLVTLALPHPLLPGQQVQLHTQTIDVPVVVKTLINIVNKSNGEVLKKKPRCLREKETATVLITSQRPLCVEEYSSLRQLGRFLLRKNQRTIAAGIVTKKTVLMSGAQPAAEVDKA